MAIGWLKLGEDDNSKTYYFTEAGLMVTKKWLQIDAKWYYFNADGTLAQNTRVDGYEVDADGVRKD
jgi:glucan-binding YG repeat protein